MASKSARKLRKIEHGGIAQLGERLNGIQEVSGSIPLISTRNRDLCDHTGPYSYFPEKVSSRQFKTLT